MKATFQNEVLITEVTIDLKTLGIPPLQESDKAIEKFKRFQAEQKKPARWYDRHR